MIQRALVFSIKWIPKKYLAWYSDGRDLKDIYNLHAAICKYVYCIDMLYNMNFERINEDKPGTV